MKRIGIFGEYTLPALSGFGADAAPCPGQQCDACLKSAVRIARVAEVPEGIKIYPTDYPPGTKLFYRADSGTSVTVPSPKATYQNILLYSTQTASESATAGWCTVGADGAVLIEWTALAAIPQNTPALDALYVPNECGNLLQSWPAAAVNARRQSGAAYVKKAQADVRAAQDAQAAADAAAAAASARAVLPAAPMAKFPVLPVLLGGGALLVLLLAFGGRR